MDGDPTAGDGVVLIDVVDTEPAPARPRRPWIGLAVAVVTAAALLLVLGRSGIGEDLVAEIPPQPDARPPSLGVDPRFSLRGPAFGEETNVILVFDDDLDGLLYVDPDRRIATRDSAGLLRQSQRAQLDHIGDVLVVGGQTIEVVSLATRQTQPIPAASYYLRSPDGALWLVDVRSLAEPVPIPVLTKVSLEGEVLRPAVEIPKRGVPAAAVADGVLLDAIDGLFLWRPGANEIEQITDESGALVVATTGPLVAWCTHDCRSLFVDNVAAQSRIEVPLARGLGPIDHTAAAWSPDGSQLVVITTEAVVRIADIATDPVVVVLTEYAIGAGAPRFVAWDPTGDHVYFATDSPQGRLTGLWRSDGTRFGTTVTTLPFAGASGPFVVLDAGRAAWLVGAQLGPAADCPAPVTVQMPEATTCSFRF